MNKLHFFSLGTVGLLILGNSLQVNKSDKIDNFSEPTQEKYLNAIKLAYDLNINTIDKDYDINKEVDDVKTGRDSFKIIDHVTSVSFHAKFATGSWFRGYDYPLSVAGALSFNQSYKGKNIGWNITTFKLPQYLKIQDFPIITFNNSNENINVPNNTVSKKPYTKASWGSWPYQGRDVKQAFDKKNILHIGNNYPATTYEDIVQYTNTYLLRKTDKYSLASVSLKIDVGLNYFTYGNHGYLQFLTYFYGETWTSASGGNLWMNWGSSFGLWKKETAKYLVD